MKGMWDQLMKESNYEERQKRLNEFNEKHKWKKRGSLF